VKRLEGCGRLGKDLHRVPIEPEQIGECPGGILVVLDQEDGDRFRLTPRGLVVGDHLWRLGPRERHDEFCTLAMSLARDAHRTAVPGGQLLHQRESHPHPAVGELRSRALNERLEDPLEVTGGDPSTRIADHHLAVVLQRRHPDRHPPSGLRELQRIVEEISHHLG